jgi:hypothetical protein
MVRYQYVDRSIQLNELIGRLIDDACSKSVPELNPEDQLPGVGLHWTSGWVTFLLSRSASERRVCKECHTKVSIFTLRLFIVLPLTT